MAERELYKYGDIMYNVDHPMQRYYIPNKEKNLKFLVSEKIPCWRILLQLYGFRIGWFGIANTLSVSCKGPASDDMAVLQSSPICFN